MSSNRPDWKAAHDAKAREARLRKGQAEVLNKIFVSVCTSVTITGGRPSSKKERASEKKQKETESDADSGGSQSTEGERKKKKKKRNFFKKAIRKIFCRKRQPESEDSPEKSSEREEEPQEEAAENEEASEALPQEEPEAPRAFEFVAWGPELSEAFGWDAAKAAEVLEEIRRDRKGKAPAPAGVLEEAEGDAGSLLSEEDPGDSAEYWFYRSARKLEQLLGRPLSRAGFRTVREAFSQRHHLPGQCEDGEPGPSSRRRERKSTGSVDTRSTFWIENERRALAGLTPGPAPASKPASLGGTPIPTPPQSAIGPEDSPEGEPPFRASMSLGESEYGADGVYTEGAVRSSITDEDLELLPRMIDTWARPVPREVLQGLPRDAQVELLREELDMISSEFILYWMLAHRGVKLGKKVEEQMGLPAFARGLGLFPFAQARRERERRLLEAKRAERPLQQQLDDLMGELLALPSTPSDEEEDDDNEAGPSRRVSTPLGGISPSSIAHDDGSVRPKSAADIAPPSTIAHVDGSDNVGEVVGDGATLEGPGVARPLSTLSEIWRAGETKRVEHGTAFNVDEIPKTRSGMWMLEKLTAFTKSFKQQKDKDGNDGDNGLGLTISNPDKGITLEELLKQERKEKETKRETTKSFRNSILSVFSKDKPQPDFTVRDNGESSSQAAAPTSRTSKRDSGIAFNRIWKDINHGVAAKLLQDSKDRRPASIFAKGFLDGIRKTPKQTPTGPDFQATMQSYFVGNLPNGPEKRAMGLGAIQAVTSHNIRQKELLEKRVAAREALGIPSSITPLELPSIPEQVVVCEPDFVFPRRDRDVTAKPAVEQGSSCIRLPSMNLGGSMNVNMFDNIGQDLNFEDTRMPIAPIEIAGTTRDGRNIVLDDEFAISTPEHDDGTPESDIAGGSQQTGSDEQSYTDSQDGSYDSRDLSEGSHDYSIDSRDRSEGSDGYTDSQSNGRSYTDSEDLSQDDSHGSSRDHSGSDSEEHSGSQGYSGSDSEERSNSQDNSHDESSQDSRGEASHHIEDGYDEDHTRNPSGESSENINEDSDEISQALSNIIGEYVSEHEEASNELQVGPTEQSMSIESPDDLTTEERQITGTSSPSGTQETETQEIDNIEAPLVNEALFTQHTTKPERFTSPISDEGAMPSPKLEASDALSETSRLVSNEEPKVNEGHEDEAADDLEPSLEITLQECEELLRECEELLSGHNFEEKATSTKPGNKPEEAKVTKAHHKPKFVSEILSTAHGGDILIDSRTPTEIIGTVGHTRTNTEASTGFHGGPAHSHADSRVSQQAFGPHDTAIGASSPRHHHRRSSLGTPSTPVTPSPVPREIHQRGQSRADAFFIHGMPQDFLAQYAARANQNLESNEFHSRANISRRPRVRPNNEPSGDI
ncbi:hypothetical protein AA313_de0206994 [Arthrobotrys entomopaga]|nr:hypothetical protein AA313_de0206994 [Arthrobotrys entomopaga]